MCIAHVSVDAPRTLYTYHSRRTPICPPFSPAPPAVRIVLPSASRLLLRPAAPPHVRPSVSIYFYHVGLWFSPRCRYRRAAHARWWLAGASSVFLLYLSHMSCWSFPLPYVPIEPDHYCFRARAPRVLLDPRFSARHCTMPVDWSVIIHIVSILGLMRVLGWLLAVCGRPGSPMIIMIATF